MALTHIFIFTIFKDFIYLLLERERGRDGEREREKHQCARETLISCLSHPTPRTWDLAHNPGMCPNWESNQRPFCSQASAQSNEPHQAGLSDIFLNVHSHN